LNRNRIVFPSPVSRTTGGLRPPLLQIAMRAFAGGIATFAMYKRTRSRSGRRKPTVRLADALPRTLRQLLGRLPPACWRTPLQWRSCDHGGLTPPALVPAKMRLCSAKVAFTVQGTTYTRSCGREPAVATGDALAKVLPQLFGRLSSVRWRTLLQSRSCNSRGTYAPALVRAPFGRPRNCHFSDVQTNNQRQERRASARRAVENRVAGTITYIFGQLVPLSTRSGGREPAVRRADALAMALPQLLGRLSPVGWRTPLQSRSCNHGGLTPPSCFACTRATVR